MTYKITRLIQKLYAWHKLETIAYKTIVSYAKDFGVPLEVVRVIIGSSLFEKIKRGGYKFKRTPSTEDCIVIAGTVYEQKIQIKEVVKVVGDITEEKAVDFLRKLEYRLYKKVVEYKEV